MEQPKYTDDELAEIKRHWQLTVADWERMTPEQRSADIQEFWLVLAMQDYNINKMDPNDPANARERPEDDVEGDLYRRENVEYGE